MAEATAELKYQIERQREELKTINDVGRLLSSTTDPAKIIRSVASYLNQTLPLAMFAVLMVEPKSLQIIRFANIGQVDFINGIRALFEQASQRLKQAVRQEEWPRVEENEGAAALGPAGPIGYLRSSHAAPLIVDGKLIGILSVYSGKTDAFSKDDQHVIEIVAEQLRAALRNAFLLEELKHANALKNELLMVISHELRIPLTSIKEGVSLVLEGALGAINADQQDFLNTVSQSADRLEMLVSKVVTASQLVSGNAQYTPLEMDVSAVVTQLGARFSTMAADKNIALEVSGADHPIKTIADSKRLAEALAQFVENAVQATSTGSVKLSCSDGPKEIEIEVADTGVGIPEEAQSKLFQQFHSVGGVDDRKTGGLGLGLFIAKAFIDVQGGSVRLASQLGKGTKVTVKLPKRSAAT